VKLERTSISFRLTCWFSAVFLVGFLIFGAVMWADLAWQLGKGRDRTLSRRAQRCADLLDATQRDPLPRQEHRFAELIDAMPEGNLVRLYEGGGKLVYPPNPSPTDFPWPPVRLTSGDAYEKVRYSGRLYRVLTRSIVMGSRTLVIRIGGQLEDNRQLLDRFQTGLLAAAPALLILSALCGYFISRRALEPVDRLTAAVRSISIGNLSGRLPIHPTGDELQRLAETCNDMLARLESAVGRINRFTADASHELRSPVSFIRTVAEYALQHGNLDTETRHQFNDILAESEEAGRMLEDLLTLARADAGRLELALESVDLSELVDEVCEKARALAQEKGQSLARGAKTPPIRVRGERSGIRRLIWTLVDNAIKFTPERGQIEIGVDSTATHARVRVRDSGIGIPTDMLPRVFERFFRADPSRSHAEGTGLGLAIAKWIADAHQARLSAESTEGHGSVFTVIFPLEGA
jgi:heavy metal sensor kinase